MATFDTVIHNPTGTAQISDEDTITVTATGFLLSGGANKAGLVLTALNVVLDVDGVIAGYGTTTRGAYTLEGSSILSVTVGASGSITGGFSAIWAEGSLDSLTNEGLISASGASATVVSFGNRDTNVLNRGLISSAAHNAIAWTGSGRHEVLNAGTITTNGDPTLFGAIVSLDPDAVESISNGGGIVGNVNLGGGDDFVFNLGFIVGDITMGNGADTVDNIDGLITGLVDLGDGTDTYTGSNRPGETVDNVHGGAGNDTINGFAGDDLLDGGGDDDVIDGGTGNDSMTGGLGNDTFSVDSLLDFINETAGQGTSDTVRATVSYVLGAASHIEFLETTNAAGTAAIKLTGNDIAQTITGNAGANTLSGLGGADVLFGLKGNDRLTGGLGNDAFVFNTKASATTNRDTITDFSSSASGNNDVIRLENAIFTKLVGTGTLSSAQFFAGTAAHDANDRIIYNKATGALIYDSNGSASGGAVQFATLSNKPTVTASDFCII